MGDGFDNDSYYRLYPPHERHIGFMLPDVVRDSYEEAVRCERARAWLASAVMVGRTLEAVCVDYNPATKTISQGLRDLYSRGVISQEILDWADQLRLIRNIGAHASATQITADDSREALDFLQAVLEILYDLRPKFERMKLRRASSRGFNPSNTAQA